MLNGMCFDVVRLGDKCGIDKSLEKGITSFQNLVYFAGNVEACGYL